ncbi:hypothetical protein QBC38DRAFT_63515 [Podospora fimiseda]|uniref:Glycoside Hydrolase Family 61 n=1 Tax=Podospora fimiseda TaxID=252190 RepID=A0AAN7GZH1_9PEZI|nr:hypothetical protein QBC38DRAFT_63515 [Podospora fimiseda]
MKFSATLQAAIGSASLLFSTQPVLADHSHNAHRHAHQQHAKKAIHSHHADAPIGQLKPRKVACHLPDDPDLVRVPGQVNNGFAMSPDDPCEDGKWCPLACKPGKVMAQWKPGTGFRYPESMYGGLYCNNGKLEKPYPKSPLCVDGTGAIKAVNKAGKIVSFCQTVLPGNEAMIIPTDVSDSAVLAVPNEKYWAGTSAHYYVNPPGISASRGCVWGVISEAIGNWTPYVAGGNTLEDGTTFAKIGWNPEWLNTPSLASETPKYGLEIKCPGGGCNGLPCAIDPSKADVGTATGGDRFCVVTVPKGGQAEIVVFNTDGSSAEPEPKKEEPKKDEPKKEPPTTSVGVKAVPSTTAAAATSAGGDRPTTTKDRPTSFSVAPKSKTTLFVGGMFIEEEVAGSTIYYDHEETPTPTPEADSSADSTPVAAAPKPSNEGGAADQHGSAIAGLVVALIAAAALF